MPAGDANFSQVGCDGAQSREIPSKARDLAPSFQAGGLKANRRQFEPDVEYRSAPDEPLRALLYDPQTSGGLLVLLPPAEADAALAELKDARRIGRALARGGKPVVVV